MYNILHQIFIPTQIPTQQNLSTIYHHLRNQQPTQKLKIQPSTQQNMQSNIEPNKQLNIQQLQMLDAQQKQYRICAPLVPIIFAYKIQSSQSLNTSKPFVGIQIIFEDTEKKRIIRNQCIAQDHQTNTSGYSFIYRLLVLEMASSYQTEIMMSITIKYGDNQSQYKDFNTMEQLCRQLSIRKFGVYNDKVYSVTKKIIRFIQPVTIDYRYNPEVGYLWIKIANYKRRKQNRTVVRIKRLFLMNSIVFKNDKLRKFVSDTIPPSYFDSYRQLQPEQALSVMVTLPKNLTNIQIPYTIEYEMPNYHSHAFTLTKQFQIQ